MTLLCSKFIRLFNSLIKFGQFVCHHQITMLREIKGVKLLVGLLVQKKLKVKYDFKIDKNSNIIFNSNSS